MKRLSWDAYFAQIARAVADRGDCTRRQVGAVIVSADHRIISTGYNGAPPRVKGCLAGGCPRGKHYDTGKLYFIPSSLVPASRMTECACGRPWPCPETVEPGSSYDTGPGSCIALHAEQNALLYAFRPVKGMTMYVTDMPCDGCLKLIRGAQLYRVKAPDYEAFGGD